MHDEASILIIDNDTKHIELQKECLEPYNYAILTASNSVEALKVLSDNTIDSIILNASTSKKNFLEITKYLKSSESTLAIPVILVSVSTGKAGKPRDRWFESDDFISKPVDLSGLATRVESLVELKACYDRIRSSNIQPENEWAEGIDALGAALEIIGDNSIETIHRMAAAAECRDQYTSSHIMRVSHYAAAIARKMGLTDGFIDDLLYAAPLHDIGKIGISDKILKKPGKLNNMEWEVMQQHTVIGNKLLHGSKKRYIKLAGEIALTHHEKWNGTGYPQGLAGNQIPVAGRIAAVADVFDALLSERPYKPSLSTRESFTIIRNEKGTHFDPGIIDAFISIKQEILSIVEKYNYSI